MDLIGLKRFATLLWVYKYTLVGVAHPIARFRGLKRFATLARAPVW